MAGFAPGSPTTSKLQRGWRHLHLTPKYRGGITLFAHSARENWGMQVRGKTPIIEECIPLSSEHRAYVLDAHAKHESIEIIAERLGRSVETIRKVVEEHPQSDATEPGPPIAECSLKSLRA